MREEKRTSSVRSRHGAFEACVAVIDPYLSEVRSARAPDPDCPVPSRAGLTLKESNTRAVLASPFSASGTSHDDLVCAIIQVVVPLSKPFHISPRVEPLE